MPNTVVFRGLAQEQADAVKPDHPESGPAPVSSIPESPPATKPATPVPGSLPFDQITQFITGLVKTAKPIGRKFKGVRSLGILPGGQLIFNSELQLDTDGSDVGAGDQTHQDQTSYRYANGSSINANKVPFFVLPQKSRWVTDLGIKLGDIGVVNYKDKLAFAVFADFGPQTKLGEGSIELHRRLGFERVKNNKIRDVGIGRGVITIVFPGSRLGSRPRDEASLLDLIQSRGKAKFAQLGGALPAEPAVA